MWRLDRRQLRAWARALLLAWSFGFASGIANACLPSSPVHDAADADGVLVTTPAHPPHETSDAARQGDGAAIDPARCIAYCDDESIRVPTAKPPSDPWSSACLPPPTSWTAPLPPVAAPSPRAAAAVLPARGVPLVIALLRLTL